MAWKTNKARGVRYQDSNEPFVVKLGRRTVGEYSSLEQAMKKANAVNGQVWHNRFMLYSAFNCNEFGVYDAEPEIVPKPAKKRRTNNSKATQRQEEKEQEEELKREALVRKRVGRTPVMRRHLQRIAAPYQGMFGGMF
jgi:hypothetical protein